MGRKLTDSEKILKLTRENADLRQTIYFLRASPRPVALELIMGMITAAKRDDTEEFLRLLSDFKLPELVSAQLQLTALRAQTER